MSLHRYFIHWDRPILWGAVDWLANQYLQSGNWNLENIIIVLPSSLASRRLLEYLVLKAEENGWNLSPPLLCTSGSLPELMYRAQRPLASDAVQTLVWSEVLMKAPPRDLDAWLFQIPDKKHLDEWMDLARNLSSMHRELASDDLDFAAVADHLRKANIAPIAEAERWDALSRLQRSYWDRLDQLELWDAQTARRVALQKKELNCQKQIVCVGNADLNLIQKRFLKESEAEVHILIGAPENWKNGFDDTGCLVAEAWQTVEIPIDDSQITVAATPADQAECIAELLHNLSGQYRSKEITVGVPDAQLLPFLKFQFHQVGLNVRYGPGTPLVDTALFKLLSALNSFLQGESYNTWASLLRQPPIENYLRRKLQLAADWLEQIDRYYNETLLRDVPSEKSPQTDRYHTKARETAISVAKELKNLCKSLRGPSRPARQWIEPIFDFLKSLLQDYDISEKDEAANSWMESCRQINDVLCIVGTIPDPLLLPFSAAECLTWILRQLSGFQIPAAHDTNAIEMLGWLELPFDDTPALVLTGMSLNVVPESVQGDSFLPNQLRSELGLVDNERRWARDAYSLMIATQARNDLRIVVGRVGTGGEPQLPSRLLFATSASHISHRVMHLLKVQSRSSGTKLQRRWRPKPEDHLIAIPEILEPRIPQVLSVTDFKSYLSCPYRFYLDRVLKLEPLDDTHLELNARRFGTMIHDCLDKLIDPKISVSQDAEEIFEFLCRHLDDLVTRRFGVDKTAALEIQIAQAQQRLQAFALEQAQRAADGWRIRYSELEIKESDASLTIPNGEPMKLKGRIDRIDYHPDLKTMAIWDYKTSETFNEPLAAHYDKRKNEWKDLQLPLYRHMVAQYREGTNLQLGYITLPRKLSEIKFRVAEFSEELLEQADQKAVEIVNSIRSASFGPPVFPPPFPQDPYEAICQNKIVRRGPYQPSDRS